MKNAEINIISKTLCFEGFFRVYKFRLQHSLFAGGLSQPISRELFTRGHAVAMLPYDPRRDEVVMIEQFRIGALEHPHGAWLIEIVAGMIAPGEDATTVARRESVEEAGCEVEALEPIYDAWYPSPGGCDETIRLYCGKVNAEHVSGIHGLAHEGEDIRVFSLPFAEAWKLLETGRINSAAPIIALQWLAMNRERLRRLWV